MPHGSVRGQLAAKADELARQLYETLDQLDVAEQSRDVLKVGYLIVHGMPTPDICERCSQAPARVGRTFCEACLTVDFG
jgi:hypothetical protein